MSKFGGDNFYREFFGFNQKLMEEDWNDDQKYVFKLKQKGDETVSSISFEVLTLCLLQEFGHTIKVGETKSDAHKVSMETKIKTVTKAWEGINNEAKIKNSGELIVDTKSDVLKVSSRNERVLEKY